MICSRHRTGSTFGLPDSIRPLGLYTRPLHDCPIARLTLSPSQKSIKSMVDKKYGAKSINCSYCVFCKFCFFLWKDTLKLSANVLFSFFLFTMRLHKHMWRQKSMESRLLIALIVIRNSAFYCDRNVWNLKTWRHKKYGVKTFDCSHCDKKFGLFCDKNVWNLKTWIHKKYGVKTFDCSHCDKKFSLTPSNYNWKKIVSEETWNKMKCSNINFFHIHKSFKSFKKLRKPSFSSKSHGLKLSHEIHSVTWANYGTALMG